MTLDFSRCRLPPFAHQKEDVEWLFVRPYALIANEMRTGKSKIVIDAAQFLFEAGVINRVVVVAPAPVRDVWYDEQLGEISKHAWENTAFAVSEFHARPRGWARVAYTVVKPPGATNTSVLQWWVTNYEFLRSKARLVQLLAIAGPKTMLVLDESSFVKNHAAQQTKACLQLRRACGRVVLLNGTPIFHSPMDLFSQGNILHSSVLDCKYVTHFKARYAIQTPVLSHGGRPLKDPYGRGIQTITGWTNLDDLQRRFAPVTIRRLQAECLDLPPKLDPVTLTATLDTSWPSYKSMRDELVVWLKSGQVATSATAAVKALRLSQITSGFLGGIEDANIEPIDEGLLDNLMEQHLGPGKPFTAQIKFIGTVAASASLPPGTSVVNRVDPNGTDSDASGAGHELTWSASGQESHSIQEIGREKLDVLLWFIGQRLEADPNLHLVAWCRFRAEMFRIFDEVRQKFPQFAMGAIHGGQKRSERLQALALLKPETSPTGPVFAVGIEGTGSFGLDMTASHTCVTMSSGYSPGRSAQTLDRVYGPGQTQPIAYYDIVAVGPKGQKTIDHAIAVARRAGENVATWTSAAWVRVLTDEV